jgi:hypothetical protein
LQKKLVYIGKISYSLYLWHWPVLAFYRYKSMRYEFNTLEIIILSIIFIVLSLISFYFVEESFRKLKGKELYWKSSLITGGIIIFWSLSLMINIKSISIPAEYIKPIPFVNHNTYSGYKLIGDKDEVDQRILLIGDSHCLSMLPFFEKVGKDFNLNFSFLSLDSAIPMSGYEKYNFTNEINKKDYQNLKPIGDSLILHSDIIIIIRQWHRSYDFSSQIEYLENTITAKQKLVFLTDYPNLRVNPVRNYLSLTKPQYFKREELKQPKMDLIVLKSIKKNHNMYLLNIKDDEFFKEAPFYNDTLMFYDDKHINSYGSEKLAEFKGRKVAMFLKGITYK